MGMGGAGRVGRSVATLTLAALVGIGTLVAVYVHWPFEPAALAAKPENGGNTGKQAGGAVPLEVYLRRWQGIPPEVQIQVGPGRPGPVRGLETLTVTLSQGGRSQSYDLQRTTDGRYLLPAPLLDLTEDPHAAVAARLDLAGRASLGRADAPVTVVEYSSFQCPYCRRLASAVKQTMQGPLGKEVRWVYKHFPLNQQAWSEPAAVATECTRQIGGDAKFWALHDLYFEQQDTFTPQNHRERAVAWAKGAGLPVKAFEGCLDSPAARKRVQEDLNEGRAIGVASTPTLVINGRLAPGVLSADGLAALLEQELAYQRARERARAGG